MSKVYRTLWNDDTQSSRVEWVRDDAVVLASVAPRGVFSVDTSIVAYSTPDGFAVWFCFARKTGSHEAEHFLGYAADINGAREYAAKWAAGDDNVKLRDFV